MAIDMNDFGGPENMDALNVLINEVTDGEGGQIEPQEPQRIEQAEPQQEPAAAENAEPSAPQPEPTAPAIPGVDMAAMLAQMQRQNDNHAQMIEQMKQQQDAKNTPPTRQLTEEEQQQEDAIAELKQRLGFGELEKQNAELKQMLQMQMQQSQTAQYEAYQKQVEGDINALKAELQGFNPDMVAKELQSMANEPYILPNGQPARDAQGNVLSKASMMDNKAGWAQIWNEKFAPKVAPKPDPIVPVGNGDNAASGKSAMERIKSADSTLEQGKALLDLIGG